MLYGLPRTPGAHHAELSLGSTVRMDARLGLSAAATPDWDALSSMLVEGTCKLLKQDNTGGQSMTKSPSALQVLLTKLEQLTTRVSALENKEKEWEADRKELEHAILNLEERVADLKMENTRFEMLEETVMWLESGAEMFACGEQTQKDIYELM